jgi:hypothetical protein
MEDNIQQLAAVEKIIFFGAQFLRTVQHHIAEIVSPCANLVVLSYYYLLCSCLVSVLQSMPSQWEEAWTWQCTICRMAWFDCEKSATSSSKYNTSIGVKQSRKLWSIWCLVSSWIIPIERIESSILRTIFALCSVDIWA